jgi:O-antigen/teichoic acid export membrane protein
MTPAEAPAAAPPPSFVEFETRGGAVAKRALISILGLAGLRAKGLVTLPLAVAILGTAGYGDVSAALATAGALTPLALLNVPDGAARLFVGASEDVAAERVLALRRAGFAVAALLSVAALVLTLASAAFPITAGLALAAAGVAFQVSSVHLQYFQRTATLVRIQIVAEYGSVGLGLLVALRLGASGMVLTNVVVLWILALFARRTLSSHTLLHDHPEAHRLSHPFWRPALRLSIPLVPIVFAQWALFSIDSLIVYNEFGARLTGAYSIAYSIGSIALLVPTGVTAVWPATAQRVLAREPERLRGLFARGMAIVVATGVVLIGSSVLLVPLIEHFVTGDEFRDVPWCVVWIVVAFSVLGVGRLSEGILYAEGRIRAIVVTYSVAAVINIVANFLLIPSHGILAAAWITAATFGLVAIGLGVLVSSSLRSHGAR